MAALKHKFILALIAVSFAQLSAGQIDDFYYGNFPDDFRWGKILDLSYKFRQFTMCFDFFLNAKVTFPLQDLQLRPIKSKVDGMQMVRARVHELTN